MSAVLKMYQRLSKWPFGKQLFSRGVNMKAPYFKSLGATIINLEHGHGEGFLRKRRSVENHIGTVHAIAMCNLCELVGGLTLDVTIPKHKRWIPKGMRVEYLKKAETHLTASSEIKNIPWDMTDVVEVQVDVKNDTDVVVMRAFIDMYISDKK